MDPYLEGALWPTVHNNLVEEIARQLAPKLRPKYLARINQRVIVATPDPSIEQTFVEIQDVAERRLVTAIEVLSMTNKRGDGLAEYRRQRQEMLAGPSHFIEIDLLRAGERFPVAGTLPSAPYFVFLSRADRRPRTEIWPIALEGPLPPISVPLLPGDADVKLDLQQALQTIYELYGYDQPEDHRGDPPHPLSPEQAAWTEERLRAAGLR